MSSNENVAVKSKPDVKNIALIGIMAAVCCVLGPWQIPIGPVPISLQIIAVCLKIADFPDILGPVTIRIC